MTPDTVGLNPDGSHKYYGRFNQGVCTINLVDVACSSEGDEEKFWQILDERAECCREALMVRHQQILDQPSDVAPILWQYGAIARLQKGEKITKYLFNNYSTIPIEGTTYYFAKALQRRWGIIPNVTDKGYITNSSHLPVTYKIDALTKLTTESEFQALSPGGNVIYCEVPNVQNNIPAILSLMKHMYDNAMYAEVNTKSDYCQVCGYDGEIQIVEDNGKLEWECPVCKNRDKSRMNVIRRTCGYLGSNFWNQGRTEEIKNRVLHVSLTEDFGK